MKETEDKNEERKWKVYMHVSPSNKRYIGVTCQNPNRRWRNGKGYLHNQYFWRAIQKYGWDHFEHKILYINLTKYEADQMERNLIKEYNSSDYHYGYNITEGGDARSGLKGEKHPMYGKHVSPEIIEKQKKTKAEHPREYTDEDRKKISQRTKEAWASGKYDKEQYQKIMKDKWRDDQYKESMSGKNAPCYGRTGESHPMYGRHGKNHPSSQSVICLNTLKIYESGREADVAHNFHRGGVNACCNGEKKSCGKDINGNKLIWMRYDEYLKLTDEEIQERLNESTKINTIKVINLDTQETFDSISEAAKSCNGNSKSISQCCSGKNKTAAGFHWMYYDEYISKDKITN